MPKEAANRRPSAPAPSPLVGEGRGGGAARSERKDGERIFASPLARRIARDKNIDLSNLKGSGPHGRIVLKDVEEAKPGAPAEAPAAAAAAPMGDATIRKFFEEGTYDVVPHDGMRKIVASRLLQATQTIPHFYLTMDCDIGTLLKVRQKLNDSAPKDADGKPAWKLSVNDFIIKALGLALMRVPDANATWTEGGMLKHHQADVGVAVAVEGGLFTPVVRAAETRTLSQISNQMKDLAARARKRRLKPEEYQGGTTAVSNLGMYGVRDFDAVINPPHATILAVGAGEDRAVVVNGEVKVRTLMSVTLSCDHRVVDGALGAELLGAFKQLYRRTGPDAGVTMIRPATKRDALHMAALADIAGHGMPAWVWSQRARKASRSSRSAAPGRCARKATSPIATPTCWNRTARSRGCCSATVSPTRWIPAIPRQFTRSFAPWPNSRRRRRARGTSTSSACSRSIAAAAWAPSSPPRRGTGGRDGHQAE
jgi:pyruvate dehydrogenase E2 component (dihydrolipoamide acetyltransferase)